MTKDEDTAGRVADYIKAHLSDDLNLKTLSEVFQISHFTLERIFKQTYGQTVHQFIREERLRKANRLLMATNDPVKIIMSKVGYKSISAFTFAFHKKFNISPAALRNIIVD